MNTLKIAKVRDTAIIPTRDEENGWYDIYANFDEDFMTFEPHETVLVPTGIATSFDYKFRAKVEERGSNTKSKLKVSAGCIDASYRGEWFVALYNTLDYPVILSKLVDKYYDDYVGDKKVRYVPYSKAIAQFAMQEVPEFETEEISLEELQSIPSKRGTGKLGSSGK